MPREHIPAGYVLTLPVSGAAALFVDSSYAFRTKVPKAIILRVLVSAGILNEEHLEDLES